jgi:transposase
MSQPEANGGAANGTPAPRQPTTRPNPEVVPKAERRHFTAEYKQRILAEADQCHERGQLGALLRREGLYSSHLDKWRQQRDRAIRQALAPQKRGRQVDPQADELERLRQENERLQARLQQAETIIDVQKKLAALFGTEPSPTPSDARR